MNDTERRADRLAALTVAALVAVLAVGIVAATWALTRDPAPTVVVVPAGTTTTTCPADGATVCWKG